MGITSFLYGDWHPDPTGTLDDLCKVVLAEDRSDIDTDAACKIADGMLRAWEGHKLAESDDDDAPPCFDDFSTAEYAYRATYLDAYQRVIRRERPGYTASDDGLGWWPECMPKRGGIPVEPVCRIATVLGEANAEADLAAQREFRRRYPEMAQ